MGDKRYRVKCEDGPRHECLTGEQLVALARSGQVDLDDLVALHGTEQWAHAWEIDGLFETSVVHALRVHREAIGRMHRSIRGGWISLIEYRRQRDEMLRRESGVATSRWSGRPRPDEIRANAQETLVRAAKEGAAAQRSARSPARLGRAPMPLDRAALTGSFQAVKGNVSQILRGDLPEWAEPEVWLGEIRRHGVGVTLRTAVLALLLDPLEPVMHAQQWLLAVCALAAAGGMLLQMGLPAGAYAGVHRSVRMLVACGAISAVFVVGKSIDVHHGLIGHFWPAMAGWQDQLSTWLQEILQRLGMGSGGTTGA
ncbi:MAG: hypothetical protein EBQ99_05305 [Planctomycetes bacterium]|nr:hypothetical protein [Planctomycetota bacterium]